MKLPSKVTPYKKSIIPKLILIIELLKDNDMTPSELYKKSKSKVDNISEFIEILECLYILEKIELIENEGVIHCVNNA